MPSRRQHPLPRGQPQIPATLANQLHTHDHDGQSECEQAMAVGDASCPHVVEPRRNTATTMEMPAAIRGPVERQAAVRGVVDLLSAIGISENVAATYLDFMKTHEQRPTRQTRERPKRIRWPFEAELGAARPSRWPMGRALCPADGRLRSSCGPTRWAAARCVSRWEPNLPSGPRCVLVPCLHVVCLAVLATTRGVNFTSSMALLPKSLCVMQCTSTCRVLSTSKVTGPLSPKCRGRRGLRGRGSGCRS